MSRAAQQMAEREKAGAARQGKLKVNLTQIASGESICQIHRWRP